MIFREIKNHRRGIRWLFFLTTLCEVKKHMPFEDLNLKLFNCYMKKSRYVFLKSKLEY